MQGLKALHLSAALLLSLLCIALAGCGAIVGDQEAVDLSDAEKAFIEKHPSIRVGADPSYPPIDFRSDNGEAIGLFPEVLEQISQRTGLKFHHVSMARWADIEAAAERGDIDLLSAVGQTASRLEYLNFSKPVLSFPAVILVRDGAARGLTLDDMSGQSVGVIQSYATVDYVKEANPSIKVVEANSAQDCLRQVASGHLDACVMTLPQASYYMEKEGINLRIAGETHFVSDHGLAMRKDWPELATIIDKAIATLTEAELQEISRNWIYVRQTSWQPSLELVLGFIGSVLLAGLIFTLFLIRSLRRMVARKTAELELELEERKRTEIALAASEERFQLAAQGSNTGILDLDLDTNEMYWSSKFKEMLGQPPDFVPTHEIYRYLIHPDDRERVDERFQYLRTHGGIYDMEYRLRRRSGNYRWFHVMGRVQLQDGRPVRITGSAVDVNDRHEAEAETRRQREIAERERKRSEELLLNILPKTIADTLKASPTTIADRFESVTVLFADIVGFTEYSAKIGPEVLVQNLNRVFTAFDMLAEKHGLEKIKTIGDAYMIAGGLPEHREDHADAIAEMALDILRVMQSVRIDTGEELAIRIGINTGPVVAGVIGSKKFIYDLWGDAVNTASRMEAHGVTGCIQVSESTYLRLRDRFTLEARSPIEVKGKGTMKTWFLTGRLGEKPSAPDGTAIILKRTAAAQATPLQPNAGPPDEAHGD